MPLDIATGLARGIFTQNGSIIRWAAGAADGRGGRIVAHLPETRLEKPAEAVARRVAALSPKVYIPVGLLVAAGVATAGWVAKQRSAQSQYVKSVVLAFETSLRAYVSAAQTGLLDTELVERLADDLDVLQGLSTKGEKIKISLDALIPLFKLVIGHTANLAEAYDFELDEIEDDGDVVVSLRRHLEAQKRILGAAA